MPELPEVETMRLGIAPVIGSTIGRVRLAACRLKPIHIGPSPAELRRRLRGQEIVDTARLGKRVVLQLGNNEAVVFEPRMTGLLVIAEPPNRTHLRLGLELAGGPVSDLWYWDRRGLGSVRLFRQEELQEEFGPHRLGPDALAINASGMRERLGHSRREIKVALLDQRALAGIGNLYASELLHVAGVHPQKRCDLVSSAMWSDICRAMKRVLRQAIRYEGSTLGDGTYRNALNKDGTYQNHHRVYMRTGSLCPTCRRAKIKRIVQAQRSTFFCPGCQTRRGR